MFLSKRAGAAALAVALTASALVVPGAVAKQSNDLHLPVLDRKSQLERSLRIGVVRADYDDVHATAKRLDLEAGPDLAESTAGVDRLREASRELREDVRVERERRAAEPEFGTPESVGVAQSTLEAIAACESGGDPTAVSADGTYRGKYQFHPSTWASVGGSGDPAAAAEAEQDYRAALLLSRSGSSPWPICG